MDVQAAQAREMQDVGGQHQSVGDHDDDIGAPAAQLAQGFLQRLRRAAQPLRLQHRQAQRKGLGLDRTSRERATAARRTVGLREDTGHLVDRGERAQGRQRERGRAREDDTQLHGSSLTGTLPYHGRRPARHGRHAGGTRT